MIKEIKIQNYKSIQNLDLPLQPINIFIGANGAGKSNFINFFKLINRVYTQNLQNFLGGNIDAFLYFGQKFSEKLSGALVFENNAIYFQIKPKTHSNTGIITELGDFFDKNNTNDFTKWQKWHKVIWDKNVEESTLINQKKWRSYHLKNYLEGLKIYHFHDTSETSPLKKIADIHNNQYLKENGENLASYLYYLQEKHSNHFRKIEMAMQSIAPFFQKFQLKPNKLNEQTIGLNWVEKDNDFLFNAHYLSDGSLRFMALATLLIQPEPPKTIIIDEPELGLHPVAISKLAGMIKNASAKSQIIISTQSVELINHFEANDIITVDRKEKQSIFTRQSEDDLANWLQDYTIGELWNKNLIGGRI